MLSIVFLFLAVGRVIGPGALFAGYGVPHLVGNASLLPGGIGVVEATMVAFYRGDAVSTGSAVIVVLGYRALNFWIPLVAGLPLAAWLEREHAMRRHRLVADAA